MAKLPQYRVYLLRCWKERSQKDQTHPGWRFAIEDATTRQRHGFSDLNSLAAFLQRNLDGEAPELELDPDEE